MSAGPPSPAPSVASRIAEARQTRSLARKPTIPRSGKWRDELGELRDKLYEKEQARIRAGNVEHRQRLANMKPTIDDDTEVSHACDLTTKAKSPVLRSRCSRHVDLAARPNRMTG